MFLDRANIEVQAGSGGDGRISFIRAKFIPQGGPDGGNGGDGGSVSIKAVRHLNSLDRVAQVPLTKAEDGDRGGTNNCTGKRGASKTLIVPCGTLIYDERGELIGDLTDDDQEIVVARGGRGGKGNLSFTNAIRQAPRLATRGGVGEQGRLTLELKLIAQVGIVGMPNAGKSTFLCATTSARPAVAPYPFTTLTPYLGVARIDERRDLVIADIPGLIEGASEGVGLGDEFLRHVERTSVLLHLVDATGGPELGTPTPCEAYAIIRRELSAYDSNLGRKREFVVLNKSDAMSAEAGAARQAELTALSGAKVYLISAATRDGVRALLFDLADAVAALTEAAPVAAKSPQLPQE